eukprot:3377778-Pyramimonas_sp.AAC.1
MPPHPHPCLRTRTHASAPACKTLEKVSRRSRTRLTTDLPADVGFFVFAGVYTAFPLAIGPHTEYILPSLLRLVLTRSIYCLPSCDWSSHGVYTASPLAIGSQEPGGGRGDAGVGGAGGGEAHRRGQRAAAAVPAGRQRGG